MRARIYQPAKNAMQSGTGKTKYWLLEVVQSKARSVDPLMGWTGSSDVESQIRLRFDSRDAAEDYAKENGYEYVVLEPKKRKPIIRQRGYGENFATDRRGTWTH